LDISVVVCGFGILVNLDPFWTKFSPLDPILTFVLKDNPDLCRFVPPFSAYFSLFLSVDLGSTWSKTAVFGPSFWPGFGHFGVSMSF
jgi:hypothetical protein